MIASEKVYAMLGNESLWDVATQCDRIFKKAGIPHSICGGVAVCIHGYQRNTTDLDIIIMAADSARVKQLLEAEAFVWEADRKEFQSPRGIPVQFLIAGEKAGMDSEVRIPEPQGESNSEERDGLSVVRLSKLIEMKLACGLGSPRRTHRDFADVVELIAIRTLDSSFARHLHKSLRATFRQLVRRATDKA